MAEHEQRELRGKERNGRDVLMIWLGVAIALFAVTVVKAMETFV